MSTNCLVTKLKSVVNNDNLEKLGVIQVSARTSTGSTPALIVNINGEHTIKVLNTNEYVVSAWDNCTKIDEHTIKCTGIGNGGFIMSSECTVVMEIEDKYDIETFDLSNVTNIARGIDSFWSSLLNLTLRTNTLSFKTSSFKKFANLEVLNIGQTFTSFTGEIDDFKDLISFRELYANNNTNCVISGNINKLGKLTVLQNITIGVKSLEGRLESFVAAQRSNGRTTESTGIFFGYGLKNVTFNGGTSLRDHNCTLTWTTDTITYDGVTISA